jgi:hypothetical protein
LTPQKIAGELWCSRRVNSSCSISGTCRVNLVANPVTSYEWGKYQEVFTTSGTYPYLLTLPLCVGVSRIRALSPAWTGSPARETLITPFPPARSPPNTKIFSRFWGSLPSLLSTFKIFRPWKKYYKILTYILQSIFLEIPHLELLRWRKTQRNTNGKGECHI